MDPREWDTNAWYAALAPFFGALVWAERAIARRRGARVADAGSTLGNLACGMGQVMVGALTGAGLLAAYDAFATRFACFVWSPTAPVTWLVALVMTDLCYYAFHRASHRVALFWMLHEPHHQSGDMDLSVALRQAWISDLTALLFYWPLPLLGVTRAVFFGAVAILSVYQALTHTSLFRGSPTWGLVFNRPATHRLHHAREPEYRDRNFGSTLIVWDRLFGTYVDERPGLPPTFGITPAFTSESPTLAQLRPVGALARRVAGAPSVLDALRMLVMPPDWRAAGERSTGPRHDVEATIRRPGASRTLGAALGVGALFLGLGAVAVSGRVGVAGYLMAALGALASMELAAALRAPTSSSESRRTWSSTRRWMRWMAASDHMRK